MGEGCAGSGGVPEREQMAPGTLDTADAPKWAMRPGAVTTWWAKLVWEAVDFRHADRLGCGRQVWRMPPNGRISRAKWWNTGTPLLERWRAPRPPGVSFCMARTAQRTGGPNSICPMASPDHGHRSTASGRKKAPRSPEIRRHGGGLGEAARSVPVGWPVLFPIPPRSFAGLPGCPRTRAIVGPWMPWRRDKRRTRRAALPLNTFSASCGARSQRK